MVKIQSPLKYFQGANVLDELGTHVKAFGDKFLVLSGNSAYRLKKDSIEKSFADAGIACTFEKFNGECSYDEIERVAGMIRNGNFNGIVGLGGGKVIDTAKAASFKANVPLVIAPTIASSDAPCSSISVVYSDKGTVVGIESFATNPAMVIVDSQMVANAPVHTLVAGIGDALATYFEARVCYENGYLNPLGSNISHTGFGLAGICYDTLLEYGYLAKMAVENKLVTPALENIIEANTYLSGIGFESGGLSCAHSIQDALTAIPECHEFLHGFRVAYGTLCLLVLENRSMEEIDEVMEFCVSVGLPVTLKELKLVENVEEKIKSIIPIAYDKDSAVYHMPVGTTAESMYAAIMMADKLGSEFLEQFQ